MFESFDVIASGMEAQRARLNVVAGNMANVKTTRTVQGGPYRRRDIVFEVADIESSSGDNTLAGVKIAGIVPDKRPFKVVYQPGHPDADKKGYVKLPNINPVEEMVNMLSATRAYEANVSAFNSTKAMMAKALEIGR